MDNQDLQFIQDQIGYNFKNLDLLQQAFIRRSYSKENGGEDNEVLEFIGDKVLDFIIVKLLAEKYGYFIHECDDYNFDNDFDEFACEYREGKLTEIKKHLVEKRMLAHRIDLLGFADCLIMGKGDEKNNIFEQDSVKEDLFEAIIGAVALDVNWDINEIQEVVNVMLDPDSELSDDSDENYVQSIQEWTAKNSNTIPLYHFEKAGYQTSWNTSSFVGISLRELCDSSFVTTPTTIREPSNISENKFYCLLKIGDDLPSFRGSGKSKSEARRNACALAYNYLNEHDLLFTIRDEIENPNKNDAINQLETLSRRGYFSIPTYNFSQKYDKNGNPVWKAECHIAEYNTYCWSESSSKKDAKKSAAFEMLKYVLNDEEE